jgi:hypothetical protein
MPSIVVLQEVCNGKVKVLQQFHPKCINECMNVHRSFQYILPERYCRIAVIVNILGVTIGVQ